MGLLGPFAGLFVKHADVALAQGDGLLCAFHIQQLQLGRFDLVAFLQSPHARLPFEDAELPFLVVKQIVAVSFQHFRIGQ